MPPDTPIFTKESLIEKLKAISALGFIANARHGNQGGAGNTLEDLLGIEENNLPIPNAAEWELKTHKIGSNSLITLFHMEPSPTAIQFVQRVLAPKYGWPHKKAGTKYPATEMSFRQTISGNTPSNRGFVVKVDRENEKVLISFDATKVVAPLLKPWLGLVKSRAGLNELDPQPYWGFEDLKHKAGSKLHNSFFVQAEVRKMLGKEEYWYTKILMLRGFKFEGMLSAIEEGDLYVDFDARTGHNHGTKFRVKESKLPELYKEVTVIL